MDKAPWVLPVLSVIAAPDIPPGQIVCASAEAVFRLAEVTRAEPFGLTDYYRKEMGADLRRFWCSGAELVRAAVLPDLKRASIELENTWREGGTRRVNLDPGYLTPLQIVLATTKPLPSATYLRDGIYAVIELLFRDGSFETLPWTYPDYSTAAGEGVFDSFRRHYLRLRRGDRTCG